jgi:drug/metabolite transporter (DMT)-like permease
MVAAMGAFSAMHATAKWLTADYPITQILFFRSLFGLLPVLLMLSSQGGPAALRSRRLPAHLLRAAFAVANLWLLFSAVAVLPLATVTAIAFTGSLFVTALSGPVLGETVGTRRWLAILVGFAGAMVIIRPGLGGVGIAAALAVAAALFYALIVLSTRWLTRTESTPALAFYYSLFGAVISLAGLPFGWIVPSWPDLGLFVLLGTFAGIGALLLAAAYRRAPIGVAVPFEYTALLWAALYGYALWGDLPDRFTLLGAAILVGSGLYILRREMRRRPAD